MNDFKTKLGCLVSSDKISEDEYRNFLLRGIQYEKFDSRYPLLQNLFPHGIPIGASETFIENINFPYQETSYICAKSSKNKPATYLYKTLKPDGGIKDLTGGRVPPVDNIFASISRIILGNHAIMMSADNLIANSDQIWNWEFFGKHLKSDRCGLYEELKQFAQKRTTSKTTHVILARKKNTFERLGFLEKYRRNKIAVFNSDNADVVIFTNQDGFEYVSKIIKPDDTVSYVVESDDAGNIDIKKCLVNLRKRFRIKKMLNDGGREMSDGIRSLGMLGGERISYEPYPGHKFIPEKITDEMILGIDGTGLDQSPIEGTVTAFSHKINIDRDETLCLHLYPM